MSNPAPDHHLALRARAGDAGAFGELYERHAPAVLAYVRRRLGDADLAEDLAADVFVKALVAIGRYRPGATPFSGWLYRIAHNRLVDHWRQLARHRTCPLDDPRAAGLADRDGPERGLDRLPLEPALATLTAEQRDVIELRYLEGCSTRETAATTARSEAAVRKLQARGLAGLRRHLASARTEVA